MGEEGRTKAISNIILLLCYICLTVLGMLLIKIGGEQQMTLVDRTISLQINVYTLIGLGCYILSFLVYIVVLPRFDLSYISPITTGAVFALVMIVSIFVLKEKIGLFQWVGIGSIILGIVFMNVKK